MIQGCIVIFHSSCMKKDIRRFHQSQTGALYLTLSSNPTISVICAVHPPPNTSLSEQLIINMHISVNSIMHDARRSHCPQGIVQRFNCLPLISDKEVTVTAMTNGVCVYQRFGFAELVRGLRRGFLAPVAWLRRAAVAGGS